MAPTNLSARFIKWGTISGARLATQIYWTYRAIKPLRAKEALYTAQ